MNLRELNSLFSFTSEGKDAHHHHHFNHLYGEHNGGLRHGIAPVVGKVHGGKVGALLRDLAGDAEGDDRHLRGTTGRIRRKDPRLH